MSKLWKDYALQIIKHRTKEIIYTDNSSYPTDVSLGDEIKPIEFRKKITPDLKGYKIKER